MLITAERYSWANSKSIFVQPSEQTAKDIKTLIRQGKYVVPTPQEDLQIGDRVVVLKPKEVDPDNYGDQGANAHQYRGMVGHIDTFGLYGEKRPDLIVLEDDALLLGNFFVRKVYS